MQGYIISNHIKNIACDGRLFLNVLQLLVRVSLLRAQWNFHLVILSKSTIENCIIMKYRGFRSWKNCQSRLMYRAYSRWEFTHTRLVHDLKTDVRRLECLRCHMGKRRNFPQSVGGNDSRVCGWEPRCVSITRVQGWKEKCGSLIARVSHGCFPNAGKFLSVIAPRI